MPSTKWLLAGVLMLSLGGSVAYTQGHGNGNGHNKHDRDDEFFFVLDGHFIIDLEDRSVELKKQEGFVVPKGVVHRTRAPERAIVLMAETAAIIPTGDA